MFQMRAGLPYDLMTLKSFEILRSMMVQACVSNHCHDLYLLRFLRVLNYS